MPELPEVETIRRQLAPLVEGRRLQWIEVLDPRWSRPLAPQELEQALVGRRIERLGRRGKYLVWSFDGDVHLAQHLRMTGSVLADPDPEPAHTRVRMQLGPARHAAAGARGTRRLVFVDPRRFGTGELLAGSGMGAKRAFPVRPGATRSRRSSLRASVWSRSTSASPRSTCVRWRRAGRRRSRRSCWTSAGSPASATSMPMRRCSGLVCTRADPRGG